MHTFSIQCFISRRLHNFPHFFTHFTLFTPFTHFTPFLLLGTAHIPQQQSIPFHTISYHFTPFHTLSHPFTPIHTPHVLNLLFTTQLIFKITNISIRNSIYHNCWKNVTNMPYFMSCFLICQCHYLKECRSYIP